MVHQPTQKRAMAFFDGQNLYRHAKAAFGHHHPNFDPVKLHEAVCNGNGWIPNLVRFYTGVPRQDRSQEWARYWSNRTIALKRAGVCVVTRPLRYREITNLLPDGSTTTTTVAQEKGIDVRLALDVVACARSRQFDVAIIFSQDQDLVEAVDEVRNISKEQNRSILIASAFPDGPNATSKRGINNTKWIKMNKHFYDNCLDYKDYR